MIRQRVALGAALALTGLVIAGRLAETALSLPMAYRLIDPGSVWRLHRHWYGQSAMRDRLDSLMEAVADDTRYRRVDKLVARRRAFFSSPFLRGAVGAPARTARRRAIMARIGEQGAVPSRTEPALRRPSGTHPRHAPRHLMANQPTMWADAISSGSPGGSLIRRFGPIGRGGQVGPA